MRVNREFHDLSYAFVVGKEGGKLQLNVLVTGGGSLQLTIQAFSDLSAP